MANYETELTRAQESTDPVELDRLSTTPFWTVRVSVARNKNTSVDTLVRQGLDDWDEDVRVAVACNPNTPIPILIELMDKGDLLERGRSGRAAKRNLASRSMLDELLDL